MSEKGQACRKCRRLIRYVQVATDAFPPFAPVFRWIAPEAKPPITCSVTDPETGGRHVPDGVTSAADVETLPLGTKLLSPDGECWKVYISRMGGRPRKMVRGIDSGAWDIKAAVERHGSFAVIWVPQSDSTS